MSEPSLSFHQKMMAGCTKPVPIYPSLEEIPRSPLRASGWYTANEVATHCRSSNCWVTILGIVYDITELLPINPQYLAEPLIRNAGRDISHWFDPRSKDVTLTFDSEMRMLRYFTPQGRFIHVPPKDPRIDWDTSFDIPWWFDTKYMIGRLSQKTRIVCIKNVLISHGIFIEVPGEETVEQILERYLVLNGHARSSTWKAVVTVGRGGEFEEMDMARTLDENGLHDERSEFAAMGLADDHLLPTLHVYFNDDLTID